MLSRNLEKSLHRALAHANERRHEYATLEHLLLALKSHFYEAAQTSPHAQQRLMLSLGEKLHSHIFRATGATRGQIFGRASTLLHYGTRTAR